jgi:hypothetical protein
VLVQELVRQQVQVPVGLEVPQAQEPVLVPLERGLLPNWLVAQVELVLVALVLVLALVQEQELRQAQCTRH